MDHCNTTSATSGEINNYLNLINFSRKLINIKISNIDISTSSRQRDKRGLINGLGIIVKLISGNLDSNGKERYNEIINHIQTNEQNLSNQLANQFSLNNELIKQYNNQSLRFLD